MPEVKKPQKNLTARQALRLKRKKLRARVNAERSELRSSVTRCLKS